MTNSPFEITIRPEQSDDLAAIAEVVEAAFGSPVEAPVVAALRASESFVPELSLVADLDGRIVGHVMITHAALDDGVERCAASSSTRLNSTRRSSAETRGRRALHRERLVE